MNAAPRTIRRRNSLFNELDVSRSQDVANTVLLPSPGIVRLRRANVSELMNRNVVSIHPDLPLATAAELFAQTDLDALPVVNAEGQILGMLEERVLRRAVQQPVEALVARSVADLCIPESIVIREHLPATQAAGLMVYEAVQRLAVVSCSDRLVGILSATDLLHWIAQCDGYVLPSPHR